MSETDRLAKATRLASLIKNHTAEFAEVERHRLDQEWEDWGETSWPVDFPEDPTVEWGGISPFVEMVEALDQALQAADFHADNPGAGEWDFLSLGSVTLFGKPRRIHAGFVQPILRLPIVRRLPDRVCAFLTQIPGERDWLEGENHANLGYHYHYLNAKKERSDVALCWDIRAKPGKGQPHPLFQEKHGESHSRFPGRPDLWGQAKRQSMHEACAKDLKRWTLDKFRMACDKAGPVWPTGAVLTARPAQKPIQPRFPSKKAKEKRR